MQRTIKLIFLTFSVALLCSAALAQSESAAGRLKTLANFKYKDDIIYKIVGDDTLKMVVFFPEKKPAGRSPVMLFTHGGGWTGGDRYVILKKNFAAPLRTLLDNGIACASIEYRLANGKSTVADAVSDCKDAGKYLVKNAAAFGFDISRIGVWGGSAGGHLSLMTGLGDDSKFPGLPELEKIHPSYKCIVSYYPQTTFKDAAIVNSTGYFTAAKLKKMFGDNYAISGNEPRIVSPSDYIKKGNPPVLLLHGTADSIISYTNSTDFISRAAKAGTKAELLTVVNGGHGFGGKNVTPSAAVISKRASDFMIEYLLR